MRADSWIFDRSPLINDGGDLRAVEPRDRTAGVFGCNFDFGLTVLIPFLEQGCIIARLAVGFTTPPRKIFPMPSKLADLPFFAHVC